MPDIAPINRNSIKPIDRTAPSHARLEVSPAAEPPSRIARSHDPADTVEVSDHARLLNKLRGLPDVRFSRVQAIRQAVADGAYENDNRLQTAIDRLIEDLEDL